LGGACVVWSVADGLVRSSAPGGVGSLWRESEKVGVVVLVGAEARARRRLDAPLRVHACECVVRVCAKPAAMCVLHLHPFQRRTGLFFLLGLSFFPTPTAHLSARTPTPTHTKTARSSSFSTPRPHSIMHRCKQKNTPKEKKRLSPPLLKPHRAPGHPTKPRKHTPPTPRIPRL